MPSDAPTGKWREEEEDYTWWARIEKEMFQK